MHSLPEFNLPVKYLKGVGPARSEHLKKLDIETIGDILYTFPRRYEDRRSLTPLRALVDGETSSVIARIVSISSRKTRRKGLSITEAVITDGESIALVIWFNRKGLERIFLSGQDVAFYGKIEKKYGKPQLTNPDFEIIENDDQISEFNRIVPVYPTTYGIYQKWLRKFISANIKLFLEKVKEFLPPEVISINNLMPLRDAIMQMHYPSDRDAWKKARKRLVFDEFFVLQAGLAMRRSAGEKTEDKAPVFSSSNISFIQAAREMFSFPLTAAQERVLVEISGDMGQDIPMNRLLQGDVGSGKTVIAVLSMLLAVKNGYQSAFMAPTEILAQQHFQKLSRYFEGHNVTLAFLTGSMNGQERKNSLQKIENGRADIVIGTHALFQEKVRYARLGLVVIDEQHRFGVIQRGALRKKGQNPHVLVMTATPIPRTLTLSVYGDLSVSVMDEMPPGRKNITTKWVRPSRIEDLKDFLRDQVKKGRQIYWVCPLIEESETIQAVSLSERYEKLKVSLGDVRVAFLHGQVAPDEKDLTMFDFEKGRIDILVSTTVIEVGVDVPNATVMVIEDANRFGLSQLHQLRGRVGRGSFKSYCFLLAEPSSIESKQRIRTMCSTENGFKIADADLRLRGPGEVCGIRQHGVTDFRVADLVKDREMLLLAREQAFRIVGNDNQLTGLPLLREEVLRRVGKVLDLVKTG